MILAAVSVGFVSAVISWWLVCGFLAYGLTFAYFQRKYPVLAAHDVADDRDFALKFACMGPFALLLAFGLSEFGRYGWTIKSPVTGG